MGMLTHVTDNGLGESITAAYAKNAQRFSSCMIEVDGSNLCKTAVIVSDVCKISIFPHDQRPEITASVVATLHAGAIEPCGIASSPSAVTVVVPSSDLEVTMERFFDNFAFPACASYRKWRTTYRTDDQRHGEAKYLYDERIIHVYGFTLQTCLDLWNVSLPIDYLGGFGAFLTELDKLGFKLPFLISSPARWEKSVHFAFTLGKDGRGMAKKAFAGNLPDNGYSCRGPVFVLFVQGPHFGDRYGIADAFVSTLRHGDIPLLALSCAVSSISAVIDGDEPDRAIEVLSTRFQVPPGRRR
jgi:hypothetical protein